MTHDMIWDDTIWDDMIWYWTIYVHNDIQITLHEQIHWMIEAYVAETMSVLTQWSPNVAISKPGDPPESTGWSSCPLLKLLFSLGGWAKLGGVWTHFQTYPSWDMKTAPGCLVKPLLSRQMSEGPVQNLRMVRGKSTRNHQFGWSHPNETMKRMAFLGFDHDPSCRLPKKGLPLVIIHFQMGFSL